MIKDIYENIDNYYVRANESLISLLDKEKSVQIDIQEYKGNNSGNISSRKMININKITMSGTEKQQVEYKQDFNQTNIEILNLEGTELVPKEELPLLIKFIKTSYAMMILTGGINSSLFISLKKVEEIIRTHFETNQKLIESWLKEADFTNHKHYKKEINKKELTVLKTHNQIKINFKNLATEHEEEYVIQPEGIHFLSTKTIENELLVFDTAYILKETLKAILKKTANDIINPKEIIRMGEIANIKPKDVYLFKRTWAKGFYEDELIEKVIKITENRKEIKEMNVYEMPKYEKKEVSIEELSKTKKFAERIKKATEYKFDDDVLNQKIYEYEKLMIEVRVNIDKLPKATKQHFEKGFKEGEYEFLILAKNFDQEEVKAYLDRYISKSIIDMNEMMQDVREKYAEEMEFMLQIVEKRRTM